jgi:hypothetical protein
MPAFSEWPPNGPIDIFSGVHDLIRHALTQTVDGMHRILHTFKATLPGVADKILRAPRLLQRKIANSEGWIWHRVSRQGTKARATRIVQPGEGRDTPAWSVGSRQ